MALALSVTLLAGLATSVGGLLALHRALHRRDVLALALAFGAGAMLTVSVVEIIPRSFIELRNTIGPLPGLVATAGAVAVGALVVLVVARVLPHSLNPAEIAGDENELSTASRRNAVLGDRGEVLQTTHERQYDVRLLRSGTLVAGIVALHNVPEGLATFITTLQDPRLGLSLAVAIAIHNIPEGIAVAAPVYAATASRARAFWCATASGIAEPLGALVGYAALSVVLPGQLFTIAFGLIAGMMVLVSLTELIPSARRYQEHNHPTPLGLLAGAGVMSLSLALLG